MYERRNWTQHFRVDGERGIAGLSDLDRQRACGRLHRGRGHRGVDHGVPVGPQWKIGRGSG